MRLLASLAVTALAQDGRGFNYGGYSDYDLSAFDGEYGFDDSYGGEFYEYGDDALDTAVAAAVETADALAGGIPQGDRDDKNYDGYEDYDLSVFDDTYGFDDSYGYGSYGNDYGALETAIAEAVAVEEFADAGAEPSVGGPERERGGRPGQGNNDEPEEFIKYLGAGNNYCNLCSGRTGALCMANRAIAGESSECPAGNYCALEVRGHRGVMKHMNIRCMAEEECLDARNQNFIMNPVNGVMQCRPTENEFLNGKVGRAYGESVCRNCVAPCAASNAADCYDPQLGNNAGSGLIEPNDLTRADWLADMTLYSNTA